MVLPDRFLSENLFQPRAVHRVLYSELRAGGDGRAFWGLSLGLALSVQPRPLSHSTGAAHLRVPSANTCDNGGEREAAIQRDEPQHDWGGTRRASGRAAGSTRRGLDPPPVGPLRDPPPGAPLRAAPPPRDRHCPALARRGRRGARGTPCWAGMRGTAGTGRRHRGHSGGGPRAVPSPGMAQALSPGLSHARPGLCHTGHREDIGAAAGGLSPCPVPSPSRAFSGQSFVPLPQVRSPQRHQRLRAAEV